MSMVIPISGEYLEAGAGLGFSETKTRMAARLAELARNGASKTANWAQHAWSFLVENLHLTKPIGWLKTGWNWTADKAGWIASRMGVTGGIGIGLLVLSTDNGRKACNNTVGWVWRTAWNIIHGARNYMYTGLRHLWIPGNLLADGLTWVNERQSDVWEWVCRNVSERLGNQWKTNSVTMRLFNTAGVSMTGIKMAMMIPNPIISGSFVGVFVLYALVRTGFIAASSGVFGQKLAHEIRVSNAADKILDAMEKDQKVPYTKAERKIAEAEAQAKAEVQIMNEDRAAGDRKAEALAKKATEQAAAKDAKPTKRNQPKPTPPVTGPAAA